MCIMPFRPLKEVVPKSSNGHHDDKVQPPLPHPPNLFFMFLHVTNIYQIL
jgi:hypothetical protein